MQPTDLKGFSAMMYTLAQVFQTELNEIQIEAYFRALSEIPIGTLQAGIAYSIKTRRFFPKPSEIRADCYSGEDDQPPRYRHAALPEHVDPKAREDAMKRIGEILASAMTKRMPSSRPARIIENEKWPMSEINWRARWDIAKNPAHPDLRFLKEAIPEHYRVKFAKQDAELQEQA